MRIGDVIDRRFWIEGRRAAGGMGVVFRALDASTDQHVAIKVLTGTEPEDIGRARREALALAVLTHPAIVRYVANGVTPTGQLYIAMEWIDGTTVADLIDHRGITLREAIGVARVVAGALAAAHDADILHRDVKPSNIVLVGGSMSDVKLIDFGVARFVGGITSLTRTGMVAGTPGYMAPEQVRGTRDLGPAADVFGLGCTLYEMLTGHYAFSGSNQLALMSKVLFTEPRPIGAFCPEMPSAVADVIARMLVKDPAKRLADGGAVAAALAALPPLPDGPRRYFTTPEPASPAPAVALAHVMVIAGRSHPDDVREPPPPELHQAIDLVIHAWGGAPVILASGAIVGYFQGERDDIRPRADKCAAELRELLPDWKVVVSSRFADAGAAAEHGAKKLATEVVAGIFGSLKPQ